MRNKWIQLAAGVVCLVAASNLQYGWTLFVDPINATHGWGRFAIQWSFAIFIAFQTWPTPLFGYLADRYGPGILVGCGGILIAAAWVCNALAQTLIALYIGAALGGIGVGIIAIACYGNAVKWFPTRRGLASGLTAAGYGAGSALTIIPIATTISLHGYQAAFMWFGLGQGIVVLALAYILRAPVVSTSTDTRPASVRFRDIAHVLKTPTFWTMYAMFTMVAMGGLMAVAQLGPIARDLQVANIPVHLFGLVLPALSFALSLDRIGNGVSRVFFGWLSDSIGRPFTMCCAFTLEAIAIYALATYAHDPLLFVILSGLVFFAWGEIFSLFPAAVGDYYGTRDVTAIYGLLYTAKGVAALLVPFGNMIAEAHGSWHAIFMLACALDIGAAILALGLKRQFERHYKLVQA